MAKTIEGRIPGRVERYRRQRDAALALGWQTTARHWSRMIALELKRPIVKRRRQTERQPESAYKRGRSLFHPSDHCDCSLAVQSPPWWMLTHGRYGTGVFTPFSEMSTTPSILDRRDMFGHYSVTAIVLQEKYGQRRRE